MSDSGNLYWGCKDVYKRQKQYSGALYSGSGDPEELLPQFLEALDDAGINDVIAAKQEQLDAFLAAK